MASHQEALLQERVANYIRATYPDVIFRSDFASGMKLSIGMAARHRRLQSGRAWPDIFIYHPSNGYYGLALELKADGVRVYLKNGELAANEHFREQAEVLQQLQDRGYQATFAAGWDEAKAVIDDYLN